MDYLIYLAGPITGLSWPEATEWRVDLINRFNNASKDGKNYMALSPLRGKEFLKNETDIKDEYTDNKMANSRFISTRDFNDVRRSDLIIVNFLNAKKVSIGTVLEIGAAIILNKPIIIIMEDKIKIPTLPAATESGFVQVVQEYTSNIHNHSMIRETTIIVNDLDEAFHMALQILG